MQTLVSQNLLPKSIRSPLRCRFKANFRRTRFALKVQIFAQGGTATGLNKGVDCANFYVELRFRRPFNITSSTVSTVKRNRRCQDQVWVGPFTYLYIVWSQSNVSPSWKLKVANITKVENQNRTAIRRRDWMRSESIANGWDALCAAPLSTLQENVLLVHLGTSYVQS